MITIHNKFHHNYHSVAVMMMTFLPSHFNTNMWEVICVLLLYSVFIPTYAYFEQSPIHGLHTIQTTEELFEHQCFVNPNSITITGNYPSATVHFSTFNCQSVKQFDIKLVLHITHNNRGQVLHYKNKNSEPEIHQSNNKLHSGTAFITETPLNVKHDSHEKTHQYQGHVSFLFLQSRHEKAFSAKIWTDTLLLEIDHNNLIENTATNLPILSLVTTKFNKMDKFTSQAMLYSQQYRQKKQIPDEMQHHQSSNRKLQQVIQFDECFANQFLHTHSVKIGLLVDNGFFSEFDYNVDQLHEYIEMMFTHANGVYEQQMNVILEIGDILVGDNVPFFENFNDAPAAGTECCTCSIQEDITTQLSLLRTWNDNWGDYAEYNCTISGYSSESDCPFADSHAAWVLLSKCVWSARSYVNVLCRDDKYNSAVVNWYYSLTWKVLAHEIGHVFGAYDWFDEGEGGIMQYGSGYYNGVNQFHPDDQSDICNGIENSMKTSNRVPNCWSAYDYGIINYRWRQSGVYQDCSPCGDWSYSVEKIECVRSADDSTISIVNDFECNPAIKPWAKFVLCTDDDATQCSQSECGDGYVEWDEECDYLLDNECCHQVTCQHLTSSTCKNLKQRIDAAFTDTSGRLYVFQSNQVAVYSSIDSKYPEYGYPKLINEVFPMLPWTSDINAAFCTNDNIVYMFKNFQYVKFDLEAVLANPNNQASLSTNNIQLYSDFGMLDSDFYYCGQVNAAFGYNDGNSILLVCEGIYYMFDITHSNLADTTQETLRPFWSDFDIQFSYHLMKNQKSIDAAVYDHLTSKNRFFLGDQFVDFQNGRQLSSSAYKITPMGYWGLNIPTPDQCSVDNCDFCYSDALHSCIQCKTGYTLHYNYCYTNDYLTVITFEDVMLDAHYIKTDATLLEFVDANNTELLSALCLHEDEYVQLHPPLNHSILLENWEVSLYLYPKMSEKLQQSSNDDDDRFEYLTIQNEGYSSLKFALKPNLQCQSFGIGVCFENRTSRQCICW